MVRVSTVTFSQGETTETDYEKRPESMDGDAGYTARTMQFLQWIYRPLRMADSITPTGVSRIASVRRYARRYVSHSCRPVAGDHTETKTKM